MRQFAKAENVRDFHTLIEGFGLTLEGKALHWFQTLDPTSFRTIEQLEKGFTAAFSKTGMKHDELSRIYGFKQEKGYLFGTVQPDYGNI